MSQALIFLLLAVMGAIVASSPTYADEKCVKIHTLDLTIKVIGSDGQSLEPTFPHEICWRDFKDQPSRLEVQFVLPKSYQLMGHKYTSKMNANKWSIPVNSKASSLPYKMVENEHTFSEGLFLINIDQSSDSKLQVVFKQESCNSNPYGVLSEVVFASSVPSVVFLSCQNKNQELEVKLYGFIDNDWFQIDKVIDSSTDKAEKLSPQLSIKTSKSESKAFFPRVVKTLDNRQKQIQLGLFFNSSEKESQKTARLSSFGPSLKSQIELVDSWFLGQELFASTLSLRDKVLGLKSEKYFHLSLNLENQKNYIPLSSGKLFAHLQLNGDWYLFTEEDDVEFLSLEFGPKWADSRNIQVYFSIAPVANRDDFLGFKFTAEYPIENNISLETSFKVASFQRSGKEEEVQQFITGLNYEF